MALRSRKVSLNRETVPVSEVTDLVAVRTGEKKRGPVAVTVGGEEVRVSPLPLARLAERIPGAERPEIARFQDQGWVFVERAALGGVPDSQCARVLVGPDGRLSLDTNRLSVKFKDADTDPEAALKAFGVKSVTPLKFAPGLYSVLLDAKADTLAVAAELTAGGTVEYAEPELVQFAGGR